MYYTRKKLLMFVGLIGYLYLGQMGVVCKDDRYTVRLKKVRLNISSGKVDKKTQRELDNQSAIV